MAEEILYSGRRKSLKRIPSAQLNKTSTKNLLAILKSVRAVKGSMLNSTRCDCCGESVFDSRNEKEERQFWQDYKKIVSYFDEIKGLLSTREHIK